LRAPELVLNNLAGHYRRYIHKFAEKSLPLIDLQKGAPKKGSAIAWGEREEAAFRTLKEALTIEPILKHPQIGKLFVIDSDGATVLGAGARAPGS
jgi:hypothetical protein